MFLSLRLEAGQEVRREVQGVAGVPRQQQYGAQDFQRLPVQLARFTPFPNHVVDGLQGTGGVSGQHLLRQHQVGVAPNQSQRLFDITERYFPVGRYRQLFQHVQRVPHGPAGVPRHHAEGVGLDRHAFLVGDVGQAIIDGLAGQAPEIVPLAA